MVASQVPRGQVKLQGVVMLIEPEWRKQVEESLPGWNVIRRHQLETRERAAERQRRNLEGIEKGAVVMLTAEITERIYGVKLCLDSGGAVLVDGEMVLIQDGLAWVGIKRRGGVHEYDDANWVSTDQIHEVIDGTQGQRRFELQVLTCTRH